MPTLMKVTVCSLLSSGIGWWVATMQNTVNSVTCPKTAGWLSGFVAVSISPLYSVFLKAYREAEGQAYDPLRPYAFSYPALWNSLLTVVSALKRLFQSKIYPSHASFHTLMLQAMKNTHEVRMVGQSPNWLSLSYTVLQACSAQASNHVSDGFSLHRPADLHPILLRTDS